MSAHSNTWPALFARLSRLRHSWLVLAGVGFLALQVLLTTQARLLEWDEAVYLSQVTPGRLALNLFAHRSRGITYVVAPASATGVDLHAVRWYLAVVTSVLIVGAFSEWRPLTGRAAALAAGIFASSWIAIYYGSEIQPNVILALAAVGLVGSALRLRGVGADGSRWIPVVLWGALAGSLRPVETAILVVVLLAGIAVGPGKRVAPALAISGGAALGALPWVVEAFVRWGGPLARARAASKSVVSGLSMNVAEHARLLDGPLIGPDRSGGIPWSGLIWWVILILLAVLGALLAQRRTDVVLVGAAGVAVAGFFFFGIGATAPRFLAPTYALLAVPAGVGLLHGLRRVRLGWVRLVAVATLLASPWWHGSVAVRIDREQVEARAVAAVLADRLANEAAGRSCVFASQYGYPQLQYWSGCRGTIYRNGEIESPALITQAEATGSAAFVLAVSTPPAGSFLDGWVAVPMDEIGWTLYMPELPASP